MGAAGRAFAIVLLSCGAVGLAGGRRSPVRLFGFRGLEGEIKFEYESETRENTSKQSGSTTRTTDERLREMFDLGWRGYIYHPRFLEYQASMGLRLEQGEVSTTSPGARPSSSAGEPLNRPPRNRSGRSSTGRRGTRR